MDNLLQLASSGKAEELRRSLKLRALRSLYFFNKTVLQYKDLVDHLHLPLCKRLQARPAPGHTRNGYLYPRAHFKSTNLKGKALWRSLPFNPEEFPELSPEEIEYLKWAHNPNLRIAFVGESDTVAQKNLNDIKWHATENVLLKWLFPEFNFDPNQTKWTDTEIIFPFRTQSFDESSITTMGVGAKRTGFHWDLIIYDDIIGEKAAESEAEMKKAQSWFQLATGMLNHPTDSEEDMIGTRWKHGEADLYGWIMKNMPEEGVSEGTDEGVGRIGGFTWMVRSAIEDGEPIFPERFTIQTLLAIKNRQKEYKFNCQYMNTPSSPEGAEFSGSLLGEYTIGEDNKTIIPSDGTLPVKLRDLYRVSFHDLSSGGKSAKCDNAIVATGESADGRIFVLGAWMKNTGYSRALEEHHLMHDRHAYHDSYYEDVGSQKEIEEIELERRYQPECRQCKEAGRITETRKYVHRKLRLKGHKPPGGLKEDRIRNYYGPRHDEKKIYLRFGMTVLKGQITEFPHGEKIDGLDALAYCVHLSRKPITQEDVASEKADMDTLIAARKPCTNTEYDYGGY